MCCEYALTRAMQQDQQWGRWAVVETPDGAGVLSEQERETKALVYGLDAAIGDALEGVRGLVMDGRTSRSFVAADVRPDGQPMGEGG